MTKTITINSVITNDLIARLQISSKSVLTKSEVNTAFDEAVTMKQAKIVSYLSDTLSKEEFENITISYAEDKPASVINPELTKSETTKNKEAKNQYADVFFLITKMKNVLETYNALLKLKYKNYRYALGNDELNELTEMGTCVLDTISKLNYSFDIDYLNQQFNSRIAEVIELSMEILKEDKNESFISDLEDYQIESLGFEDERELMYELGYPVPEEAEEEEDDYTHSTAVHPDYIEE